MDGRPEPSAGLVHDYLLVLRGAERTFAEIAASWPAAPIYTTAYSEVGTDGRFAAREVRTSFLRRLGVHQSWFRALLPVYPAAVGRLDVSPHDLVVSSSSAFAHGVRAREGATHVCYCHSPFRYAWHERERALAEAPRALRPVLDRVLERIRRWDVEAARRVTRYVANSELTRRRIADDYGRESALVHPPVDVERFAGTEPSPEDYFLLVTELVPHKRVEGVLLAARRAGVRLRVAGDGPEGERLRQGFGDVAEFRGRVSDAELNRLYAGARALLVPNVEEFGIAAVEAQAAGRPVVAPSEGGTGETVVDGTTGVLLDHPSVDAFAEVLREVDFEAFSAAAAREQAARFSAARFRRELAAQVAAARSG